MRSFIDYNGNEVEFTELTSTDYNGHHFAYLQPNTKFEGLEDGEGLIVLIDKDEDGEERLTPMFEGDVDDSVFDAIEAKLLGKNARATEADQTDDQIVASAPVGDADCFAEYLGSDKEFTVPAGTAQIGAYAFDSNATLQKLTALAPLKAIGNSAFYGCTALKAITLPSTLKKIENGAFECCESLADLELPMGLTYIGDSAFECCDSLVSLTIPSSITHIGNHAFSDCQGLKSVTIKSGAKNLCADVFANCASLTIYLEDARVPASWDKNWNRDNCKVVFNCK